MSLPREVELRLKLLPYVRFAAKIDALDVISEKAPELSRRQFTHAHGGRFTIHDPKPAELGRLAALQLDRIEIAVDVKVGPKYESRRDRLLEEVYHLLAQTIFPWHGYGISAGSSRAMGANVRFLSRARPLPHETMYLGNKVDHAFLRLYKKMKDHGVALPAKSQTIRLELQLNEQGCQYHGLHTVGDLLNTNLRETMKRYFNASWPVAMGASTGWRLYRRNRPLFRVIDERLRAVRQREIDEALALSGSHSLYGFDAVKANRTVAIEELNRRMRRSLGELSKTWERTVCRSKTCGGTHV